MSPARIIFIRHAEEHGTSGVTFEGQRNAQSLTVRGWQRAGALARYFSPLEAHNDLTPNAIFASHIAEGSETRRPQETVAPLVNLLPQAAYSTDFAKTEVEALMADVLTRAGTVLVVWEHSMMPRCIAQLRTSGAPSEWPSERYDLLWVLDRNVDGWNFTQRSQLLLDGDH